MARRRSYGEETVVMRIPKSMVSHIERMLNERRIIETRVAEVTPGLIQLSEVMAAAFRKTMLPMLRIAEDKAKETGNVSGLANVQALIEDIESDTYIGKMAQSISEGYLLAREEKELTNKLLPKGSKL